MARIWTEGFEFGDSHSLDYISGAVANISSSESRSGTYNMYLGAANAYKNIDAVSEIYLRSGVRYDAAAGKLEISCRDDSTNLMSVYWLINNPPEIRVNGATVATGTTLMPMNVWNLLEVHFKLDDVDGLIELKINGVIEATYSGDTKPTAATVFNRIHFSSDASNTQTRYDDIAINDTSGTEDNSWCGDGHIVLYKPNATGSATMLMGNDEDQIDNYALVDDIPSDGDTTYVYSGSPGYYDLYGIEDTALPVNSVIKRIWVESRAKDPDTGYLNSVIQTSSGSYTSGSVQVTTDYASQKYDEYTTNPETGEAWTSDEIDNLQIGIQIAE